MTLLPQCAGPKLAPFSNENHVDIEFLHRIASGGHAHVWKVAIGGQIYALKMFKFNQPDGIPLGIERPPGSWQETDQFCCECRAYGRLKEVGREDLAVKCHGYLNLTEDQEKYLSDIGMDDWDRWEDDPDEGPIRAIVKDYESSDIHFTPRMIPQMIRDLKTYHRLGILLHDVKETNYIDGRFCDFSYAWTVPHFMLDPDGPNGENQVYEDAISDLCSFDWMIDEWNEDHEKEGKRIWHRIFPHHERFRNSLRNFKPIHVPVPWIPSDYDWLEAEKERTRSSA